MDKEAAKASGIFLDAGFEGGCSCGFCSHSPEVSFMALQTMRSLSQSKAGCQQLGKLSAEGQCNKEDVISLHMASGWITRPIKPVLIASVRGSS